MFIRRWGSHWGIRGENDLAALPILLLIVTIMSFASAPAQNVFSRVIEHRADAYAMKMTGDGDAAIRAFQRIAKENLSPVTGPKLVQWFRGSHPTIMERILYFEQFGR
ncbi:M48 family metalloprotease [Paenibacillus sp. V4I7]|uniref:M48 family metalloprotease n=1 Tax=Paenibacillus sp. V4I7 TaxID=3042307 RepID=UPI0027874CC7|nr:M48 family metalloprotease [Paenibacillus sp. V4I7]MDQ0899439.1 Zn-dependent protease with chaperone function [Paenibacillus sp. V4I7]